MTARWLSFCCNTKEICPVFVSVVSIIVEGQGLNSAKVCTGRSTTNFPERGIEFGPPTMPPPPHVLGADDVPSLYDFGHEEDLRAVVFRIASKRTVPGPDG